MPGLAVRELLLAKRVVVSTPFPLPPLFLPSYFSIGKDWLTRLLVVVRRRRIAPLAAGVRLRLGSAVRGRVGAGRVSLWVWDRRG